MAQITLASGSADWAVKQVYTPEQMKFMVHKKDQLLMRVAKEETWRGGQYIFNVGYGYGQGGAVETYSKAYDNAGAPLSKKFAFDQSKFYALARIDNHAIVNTSGNAQAFLNLVEHEMNARLDFLGWMMSSALYRPADGRIGVVSSEAGTNPEKITLTNKSDAANFEVGMKIVVAVDAASALTSGTADTVTAVNRGTGVITLSGAGNASYTANDLIFREGTYDSASDVNSVTGLDAWLPTTDPTTTDIGGVDRSADPVRLAGHRLDGSSGDLESLIQELGFSIAREGGTANVAVMSPGRMHQLQQDLGGRVQFERCKVGDASTGEVGFNNIIVNAGGGIECFTSWACPDDKIYVLDLATWKIPSAGSAPHLDEQDGRVIKTDLVSTTAGIVIRAQAFWNLVCSKPGSNGVIHTLPSL